MSDADYICHHCHHEVSWLKCPHCGENCADLHGMNATIDMLEMKIGQLEGRRCEGCAESCVSYHYSPGDLECRYLMCRVAPDFYCKDFKERK